MASPCNNFFTSNAIMQCDLCSLCKECCKCDEGFNAAMSKKVKAPDLFPKTFEAKSHTRADIELVLFTKEKVKY